MSELPKIAQDRLIKTFPGPHPEADLLAAFAEQSLGGAERERVMAHLAACADCREVVHLGMPPLEETQKVFAGSPQNKMFGWSRMRWGALAAGMAAVVTVVVLTQDSGDRSVARLPKADDERTLIAVSKTPAPPAKEPAAKSVDGKVQTAAGPGAKADVVQPPPARAAQASQEYALSAGKQSQGPQTQGALSSADYGYAPMPQQTAKLSQATAPAQNQVQNVNGARAQTDAMSAPAAGQAVMADAAKPAAPAPAAVTVRRAEADLKKEAAKDELSANKADAAALYAPSTANKPISASEANAFRLKMEPKNAAANLARSSDGGIWRISGGELQLMGGTPQRDRDDAAANKKTKITASPELAEAWRQIKTARDVPLVAISALGTNIWVGGANGSLQHSSDNGKSWSEVQGPWPPDATIVSVRFRDVSHGELKTGAGERWTTEDAGVTWRIQR